MERHERDRQGGKRSLLLFSALQLLDSGIWVWGLENVAGSKLVQSSKFKVQRSSNKSISILLMPCHCNMHATSTHATASLSDIYSTLPTLQQKRSPVTGLGIQRSDFRGGNVFRILYEGILSNDRFCALHFTEKYICLPYQGIGCD